MAYITTESKKLVQEARDRSVDNVLAPKGVGAFTGRPRERSTSVAVRKEARVCVMCEHCWYAETSTRRSDMIKCPACLANQPFKSELTEAERAAEKEKFGIHCEKVAERKKQLMAAASRARSSKPPLP